MKLKSGMIVATVFSLWFSVYFNEAVETVVSCVLIMSFGVLHGANDIRLIQNGNSNNSKSELLKTVGAYILVVLGILALFYFFSVLALGMFILVSGYHFGEQHWSKSMIKDSRLNTVFYLIYGLFVLFMIFYIKSEHVISVLNEIMGIGLTEEVFGYSLITLGVVLFALGTYCFFQTLTTANIWEELFVIFVFFIIFNTASLLWGFCIYFIIWHSIPSLMDQMNYLYGEASWKSLVLYVKESILYWVISIIGLLGLLWALQGNTEDLITVLIYFLAAITFPHVFVMSKLEKSLKN